MKRSEYAKTMELLGLKVKNLDYKSRTIPFLCGRADIFYISQLTDRTALMENVVKPLVLHCAAKKRVDAKLAMDRVLFSDNCKAETDAAKIEDFILSGMVVILFSNDRDYIVINLKKVEHRSVSEPELTYTIRGPQDCFVENMDTNLSLLRYRVKDPRMRIKMLKVGRRTKANVALIYIEDIANDAVVKEIQSRIEDIDIDGIGESGELQAFLLNTRRELLPNIGLIERSDMACHSLIEGKVLVIVDGSQIVLVAPKTFSEFFYSCDDRYDNKFFGTFARLLRYTAVLIALTSSSMFIAISAFHTDVLPTSYAITLAASRSKVPFNSVVGVLFLEFIVELLREALLRIPRQIGPAIGIVGAIIIGQAAVSAGIFSPLLLIIVSTALLASFAIPDYSLMNPFRILKIVLIIFTGVMGLYGFTLFLIVILAELVSLNSFGVPYLAPVAPFNLYDFIRTLFQNVTTDPLRPKYLRTKDKTKTGKARNGSSPQ